MRNRKDIIMRDYIINNIDNGIYKKFRTRCIMCINRHNKIVSIDMLNEITSIILEIRKECPSINNEILYHLKNDFIDEFCNK
jgi:hypothetical protein